MKRFVSLVTLLGLLGFGIHLAAQTPPAFDSRASAPTQTSSQSPSTANPDTSVPQAQTDATNSHPSARAFEGTIQKSGDELVLQESMTKTSYKLDNQNQAKKFEGKDVRVMATMDPGTNRLHVVDIMRADTQ